MLKRKIDKFLCDWKESKEKLPLIIRRSRQIGKTTSIRNFGKKNYENLIEINFIFGEKYMTFFESKNVNNILRVLSILNKNFKFVPKKH